MNPAFKDITPQEANDLRKEFAESAVNKFLSVGNAMGEYAASLRTLKPKKAEPTLAATIKPAAKPKAKPPVVATNFDPATLEVGAIMYNGAKSRVLINGTVYRLGQKVSGAVIESITQTDVTLRVGNAKFKLSI
ncbi:MAG: general secretion pathway protein GspB [bacterium]|nr:general secretion pathway protein GspB [bacterium]